MPPALLRRLTPNALRSKVSDGQGKEVRPPVGAPVGAPATIYTGQQLLNAARGSEGWPYSTAGGRIDPSSGYSDCSGLVVQAFRRLGIWPGGTVSTSLETWAVNNGGRYVDRQYAITHPAIGIAVWGYSSGGHIGISVGDGRQHYGTPRRSCGLPRTVGFAPFDCFRWGEYFTWPYINHEGPVVPPAPPPEQPKVNFSGADDMDGIVAGGEPHIFFVVQDGPNAGALAELHGPVGKFKPEYIFPKGTCRTGPEARVRVVDYAPSHEAFGFVVYALGKSGDRTPAAWWKADAQGKFMGWEKDLMTSWGV